MELTEILAQTFPASTFRDDTPVESVIKDRADWLAFAHALEREGYELTNSDVSSWKSIGTMVAAIQERRMG